MKDRHSQLGGSATNQKRTTILVIIGALPIIAYVGLRDVSWHGSSSLHTSMEVTATLLALIVGIMALVRFYTKKSNSFLLIGAGFCGSAFLDLCHAIITSEAFEPYLSSELPTVIPWSWVASRQYLAVFLFLSWFTWWRQERICNECNIKERTVFFCAAIYAGFSLLFFNFAPLPRVYYPEFFFHRPEEFLPGGFFLLALIGYVYKGSWRNDAFETWLVLSLTIAVTGQVLIMSFSGEIFDTEFDISHLLKIVSYGCVLVGLLESMYSTFRSEAESRETIQIARNKAEASLSELKCYKLALDNHAIVATTDTAGTITYVNEKFRKISGYSDVELVGANHRLLNSGHHSKAFFKSLYKTLANGKFWYGEIKNMAKDGSYYWVDTSITPIRNENGKITQYIAIRADITDLKKAEEDLIAHSDLLEDRVEEATSALWTKTKELESALAKEKEMGELQRQFVAMASHEFRTPLAIIDSTAQRLKRRVGNNKLTPEDAIQRIDRIRKAVQRMTRLMESTLSLARAEGGQIEINLSACDINQVVKDICERHNELSATHTIISDLGKMPDSVQADPGALEQVLTNLVSNAVKYSPDNPEITINTRCLDDEVVIEVKDNGIGIDEDDLDKIGNRFFRAKTSTGIEGTGIGHFLTRLLVEKHGGHINVESRKGEGSTFTVCLPVGGPPLEEQQATNIQDQPQAKSA